MCEIDTKHKIGSTILLIFWMYMFLIIAFFIKIIVVNNGLRSFDLVSKNIFNNYIFEYILNEIPERFYWVGTVKMNA